MVGWKCPKDCTVRISCPFGPFWAHGVYPSPRKKQFVFSKQCETSPRILQVSQSHQPPFPPPQPLRWCEEKGLLRWCIGNGAWCQTVRVGVQVGVLRWGVPVCGWTSGPVAQGSMPRPIAEGPHGWPQSKGMGALGQAGCDKAWSPRQSFWGGTCDPFHDFLKVCPK